MKLGIIPEPLEMSVGTENAFTLTRLCEVEYDEGSKKAYDALVKFLSDAFSMSLLGTGKERVILRINDSLEYAEGYTLTVYEDTAIIEGKDEAGVFYGVQSFKQFLFQSDLILPEIYIKETKVPNVYLLPAGPTPPNPYPRPPRAAENSTGRPSP